MPPFPYLPLFYTPIFGFFAGNEKKGRSSDKGDKNVKKPTSKQGKKTFHRPSNKQKNEFQGTKAEKLQKLKKKRKLKKQRLQQKKEKLRSGEDRNKIVKNTDKSKSRIAARNRLSKKFKVKPKHKK